MADLSPRERVKERVPTLTAYADDIKDVEPDICNEFGPWSALKLIVHVATVNMYTTVISEHFDDWFYIDALAGSGVSVYGDAGDCFLGSPLLAAANAAEPFTKMYFVEENEEKAAALDERLDVLFNRTTNRITPPECGYDIFVGDANEKLDDVVSDMWKVARRNGDPYFNHLSFIDNQGLDLDWTGVRALAPNPTGDLLINFPTSNVSRTANHTPSKDTVTEFYGGGMWGQAHDQRKLLEIYRRRLRSVEKTEQVVTTIDSGEKNYHYDMIYATRETKGGSEYVEAIEYVREFVEAVDGADVEEMLQILRGDQSTMEAFLPETDDDDPQLGLHEFND
jgi:three-Cys-motif partner protein